MQIDRHKMIEFKQKGDDRGKLVVVEGTKDIPFEIKKIFYIYGSDSTVVRGQHANRRSEFVLINVCGSSKVRINDGKKDEIFIFNNPTYRYIYPQNGMEGYVWFFKRQYTSGF